MPAPSATEWPPRLAILAGGLATRLRPLTIATPKSLIPVAGEPFLAHQLRHLHNQGLREIVLCCGHLGEQIEAFAGDGRRFGLKLFYSHDGDQPLGTGGAIRAALPLLGRRFLIMYGDSWLSEPIQPVWRAFLAGRKAALMTVFRNRNRWGASNVEFRRGAVIRYDKAHPTAAMFHIDYGLEAVEASAFEASVFEFSMRSPFDLSEIWAALASSERLAGYETRERFYEIGSLAGLRETETAIAAVRKATRNAARVPAPPVPGAGASSSLHDGVEEAQL